MKRLLEMADRFLKASDWKVISLLKICLSAMGVLIGISIPDRKKRPAAWVAGIAFLATYLPLMFKFARSQTGPECREAKEP